MQVVKHLSVCLNSKLEGPELCNAKEKKGLVDVDEWELISFAFVVVMYKIPGLTERR